MSYNGGYGGGYGGGGGGGGGGYGGGYGGGGGGGYGGGGGGYGGGGGGYGRGPRRNDRGRGPRGGGGRTLPETTAVRMRKMIAKYAEDEDFDALEDPPRLAKVLRRSWHEGGPGALEGFRNAVTEQPYKHPHLVTLLLHLAYSIDEGAKPPADEPMADASGDAAAAEGAAAGGSGGAGGAGGADGEPKAGDKSKAAGEDDECGREVIEDLGRAFRNAVEGRQWRDARLLLQFLSLLVPAGLVSSASIVEVYKGLLTVINEVGGGGDRAERACRAVTEGLMRSAHGLVPTFSGDVEDLVGAIEGWVYGRKGSRELINPFAPILDAGEEPEPYKDSVAEFLAALHALRADGYAPPSVLPRPSESVTLPEGAILPDPYSLSPVNMPPDLYEASDDLDNGQVGEGQAGCLRLFAEDVVPPADTVVGWTLRSLFLDMINIYEVNRKECARLLLALPHSLAPGTFKAEGNESTVSLESFIVNAMLAGLFSLNPLPFRPIYYGSVITELCKLSPTTVAPPVGRAVRKLFTYMGADGLDLEIARRAAEWFAIHLSNFGFQWMWKEWVPELELPTGHPKRAFMRRVVELEVRLAYHDRIHQTLPEPMLEKGAGVIADAPPEPVWAYENNEHPLHAEATELLRLMRQKVPANEVKAYLDSLPGAHADGAGASDPLAAPVLAMAVETVQHLGARSFSHFLNATERYLDVLRHATPDAASRRVLLDAVASFWRQSAQMRLITTDKYLQYGILEPMDVVSWVFADDAAAAAGGTDAADGWTDGDKWELLRMTLDKVQGRVKAVSRRLAAVEKADEVARARRAAERLESGEGVGDDEDGEDETLERSREARDAQASLDTQAERADRVFVATARAFVAALIPWALPSDGAAGAAEAEEGEEGEAGSDGLRAVLALQDAGELGAWSTRAKWGWYREFARRYATGIRELDDRVRADILAKIPERAAADGPDARAENMVRRVWMDAVQLE